MGMYTGLRCKVVIKPEYREELQRLHEEGYEWETSEFDFMREYGQLGRASFIPRGSLSYMPNEWEDIPLKEDGSLDYRNGTATDGFVRSFDSDTGYWTFQCSLKNYENEIESFFEIVLSKITESIEHLEYFYEEWSSSVFYDLDEGEIAKSTREGIKYQDNNYGGW
ncbi:hypothetical protein [Paenibacillus sp. 1781tsa1]|uniref:hypothetical protein n=1 Tax=Paenibacillus sp. 1781tsa1 TaxID=2953810 RepID=UPI00209F5056|nr:hypothetical protein [Paenibacillus sp. 1781tsa1]MCP1184952.1 hypothetical protein [Paenibacillus sp. 1781tsa1]